MTTASAKHVCVVGAGMSGLVAMKECLNEGFKVTCYELDSDVDGVDDIAPGDDKPKQRTPIIKFQPKPFVCINLFNVTSFFIYDKEGNDMIGRFSAAKYVSGGIWCEKRNVKDPNTPQIWEHLITNSSKYLTTFSDYPPLAEDTPFLRGQDMHAYYKRYAKDNQLLPCIQFNTHVVKICKTRDHEKTGQWQVFSCPTSRCSPDDVSTENTSKNIDLQKCIQRIFDFVLICNGFFKTPVYPSIPGLETFPGTVQHSFHYIDGSQYNKKNVLVVGNSFSAGDISFDISTKAKQVHLSLRQGTWIVPRILSGGRPLDTCKKRCDIYSWNPEKIINKILISEAQNKLDHVTSGICPDEPPSLSAWMVGDAIYTALMSGQIKTYGHLARIDGCDAVFQDGTRVTGLDAIVLCTGYEPEYNFLDQDLLQEFDQMGLYKMVFPIDENKNTLGFIGAFGGFSSIVPMSELQSRYSAKIFAGKLSLPPVDVMKADVQFWMKLCTRNRNRKYYYYLPCLEFQDTIAKLLGVFPGFWRLLIVDPVLAYRCWYGPMFSAQYRLLGPDSNWKQARDICNTAYTEGCLSLRHSKQQMEGIKKSHGNNMPYIFIACGLSVLASAVCFCYPFHKYYD